MNSNNFVANYLFETGIPDPVKNFFYYPKKWQDTLQKPLNLEYILERYSLGYYGKIRFPEIYIRNSGVCMFSVGSKYWTHNHLSSFRGCVSHILHAEVETTEPDFFEKQKALDISVRHPLAIWDALITEHQAKYRSFEVPTDIGGAVCWAVLGYHLYLLKENGDLPAALVKRLTNSGNFQGALYEIYVASMMIVCGYKISWLEHSSETSVEFIATHPDGRKFAVEAKSRHRPGVLSKGGIDTPDAPSRVGFQSNIIAGIRKNPELPLLLFVDANVPYTIDEMKPQMIHEVESAWTKKVDRREWAEEGFPCVGIIVTNDTLNWKIRDEFDNSSKPGWVWWETGPHRHGFDAAPYLNEICINGAKANLIPDLKWKTTMSSLRQV